MNRTKQKIFKVSLFSVIILITLWFVKDFNLSWVEIKNNHAEITINFLFPMNKDKLSQCIQLTNDLPYATDFDYSLHWLTDSVVSIRLKEQSTIKGQRIHFLIKKAPSQYPFISKNANISVQFKSDVELLKPEKQLLIATNQPFVIQFNTPMDKNKINKFLECDAAFYIEPQKITNDAGKEIEDPCSFKFTPKTPLNNGQKYILSFRKGMPSKSGVLLKEDIPVILTTDIKPIVVSTYPAPNSKWIGLYPKLIAETDSETAGGSVRIGDKTVAGTYLDPYHMEFLLPEVLEPDTHYEAIFEVYTASGEKSEPQITSFTTVRLDENKLWMEVLVKKEPKLNIYKGKKIIKTLNCSIGDTTYLPPLGTYYTQDKGEVLVDARNREGANFWIKVSDTCFLQGVIRDAYWNIKPEFLKQFGSQIKHPNIILKDEDIRWLYQNISSDTMVIIHR